MDLSADCGEGFDDAGMLAVVTSANVACGGHVGTPESLAPVVALAAHRTVAVGAQVSYVDREGFGRRPVAVDADTLRAQLLWQVGGLASLCRAVGSEVRYLRPHGALYHAALAGGDHGDTVAGVAGILGVPLLLMPGGRRGDVAEGFADRAYDETADGPRLRPRDEPGAVLTDPAAAGAQAVRLAEAGLRSLCVHGDSPGAVETARAVRTALERAGWTLRAFA